jgi:hypothetical protein
MRIGCILKIPSKTSLRNEEAILYFKMTINEVSRGLF